MPIKLKCNCGQVLNVPEAMAGKTGKCPKCQAALRIPAAASATAAAPATAKPAAAKPAAAPAAKPAASKLLPSQPRKQRQPLSLRQRQAWMISSMRLV